MPVKLPRTLAALTAALLLGTGSMAVAQLATPRFPTLLQDEGATIQVVGRASNVTRQGFTLTARQMTFQVSARRQDVLRGQTVRNGATVRVLGDLTAQNRIDADQIQVLDQAGRPGQIGGRPPQPGRPNRPATRTVQGTIQNINRNQNRLQVNTGNGNLRVNWDQDTQFIRNGRDSRPADFREGDEVRVVGDRGGQNQIDARRIISGGRAGWANGGVGEILSMDGRTQELEIDFDGAVWTVRANNATIQQNNRSVPFNTLRLGQDVRVFGTQRGSDAVDANRLVIVRDARR